MADSYFGQDEPWVRHKNSTKELTMSNCLDVVTIEDLVEAPHAIAFDPWLQQWAFEVIGSEGFPRTMLGVLVIKRVGSKLVTIVE